MKLKSKIGFFRLQMVCNRDCKFESLSTNDTAVVGRVMKKALPEHAKLSKESKVCIQECVSEFISFITSQAIDRCKVEKRKTLNGEDILWAMFTLGFENYSETLKIYLAKYREYEQQEAEKRPPRRPRRKSRPQAATTDYESEEFYSEDISPGNSDVPSDPNQAPLPLPVDNPEFKYDYQEPGFANYSLSQRSSINNYLILPTSRSMSSQKNSEDDNELPNFDEFVDRI